MAFTCIVGNSGMCVGLATLRVAAGRKRGQGLGKHQVWEAALEILLVGGMAAMHGFETKFSLPSTIDVQEPYKSHGSSAVPGSAVLGYSFPESVGSLGANGPLRGVGAAVAALLVAAEAHRNAGLASRNVAAELEQLVDSLAEGGYARGDHRSGEA